MTVISYPIPDFANEPVRVGFYSPRNFDISAISLGMETTVTTVADHNFVVGQRVRCIIPPDYGTRQLNSIESLVTSIPSDTQIVLNIDSRNFDTFVNPGTGTPAQVKPIGDINTGIISSTGSVISSTTIPGSFKNIS